jgi:phosphoribosylaminoimidazolecarboxamide formyltransferase / IMP cyclohydrolase
VPRALLSVYDKNGIVALARGLHDLGFELVSSGGTASYLVEHELPVTTVEEVTGAPEMLGGRVKTLHPRIHGGILARRELAEDRAALAEQEIEPIDLVCVNLYPFAAAAARPGASDGDVVEMIDVGGPSMLRAAAKNFAHVAVVSDPAQYDGVLEELREHGEVRAETREQLAAAAFAASAAYEAAIAGWFAGRDRFAITLEQAAELSYGENPHQDAAYYREVGAPTHLLANLEQLGGKALSFNNLADLEAGASPASSTGRRR